MEKYGRELHIHLTILLIINSQIMFGVGSIAHDQAIGTLQQKKIQEDFLIKVTFSLILKVIGGMFTGSLTVKINLNFKLFDLSSSILDLFRIHMAIQTLLYKGLG